MNQQILLPLKWDNLVFNADIMNINKDAKYIKTDFYQIHDTFKAASILKKDTVYYALCLDVTDWNGNTYIINLNQSTLFV